MPKTTNKLPQDGEAVRFRLEGDKHLHSGTYTTEKGFEICNCFVCYTMEDVDYWRNDDIDTTVSQMPQFASIQGIK